MDIVAATGPWLDQVLDSSHALWGEGLSRRAYEHYNAAQLKTPWGARHLQRVALVHDGQVLSSAKRYELEAVIDGEPVRVLGIGAVFTPPPHRGRGYAAMLLERLLDEAAREGFGAALLFSEIGERYYARLGFATVPTQMLELEIKRVPGTPGIAVRSGERTDLPAIAEIEAEREGAWHFALRRTPEWIEYGLAKKRLLAGLLPRGSRDVHFFVVEEGGRAAAWVVLMGGARGLLLEECGDRDSSGARVGALLQAVVAREPALRAPAIRGWLPAGWLPPQLTIRSRAAAAEIMMIKGLRAGIPRRPLGASDVRYWHGDVF